MNLVRHIASFLVAAIVLLVFFYFAISLCMWFFILTGRSVVGEPMFFDLRTPSWGSLLAFQVICLIVLSLGYFILRKLVNPLPRKST